MDEESEDYGSLAEALIGAAEAVIGPSPIPDPVWTFKYMDGPSGVPGRELTRDEILVTKFFVVSRNGVPVLGIEQEEDGSFYAVGLKISGDEGFDDE